MRESKGEMMYTWTINGHTLEFIDESHTYLVDGEVVPSVTQLLNRKFGHKYDNIPAETLKKAAEYGTMVHKVVEEYCTKKKESDIRELHDFKFLKKYYGFTVYKNELPIILEFGGKTYAGRLDLILKTNGKRYAVADIKTTATLDKEYLGHQLNLYRMGVEQSYGLKIEHLYGIQLREGKRKFLEIPIKEEEWLLESLGLKETE